MTARKGNGPRQRAARRLELMPLDAVQPAARNPKGHALEGITGSIAHHGYAEPMLLDERTGRLVAGHGRRDAIAAMRDAGQTPPEGVEVDDTGAWLVPVVRGWSSRSDGDAEAYLVASNRLTELGGWDTEGLTAMLDDLAAADLLELTGYSAADVDELHAAAAHASSRQARTAPDDVPPIPEGEPVTKPGTLWTFGPHRLLCGDSRDPDAVARLLDGEAIGHLFTSPPYNVGVEYHEHDDKPAPWADYRRFLAAVLEAWIPHLADGHALAWNVGTSPKTYHARQHLLLEDAGLTYLRTLIWQKVGVPVPLWHFTESDARARQFTPNYTHELVMVFARGEYDAGGGDPDPARALAAWPSRRPLTPAERHELVVVFSKGKKLKKGKPVALSDTLANDVFTVAQQSSTRDLPDDAAANRTGVESNLDRRARKVHPAPFPVALPEAFATHLSDVGEVIADPFAGVGSTILAAWRIGRRGYGMELDPAYVDAAARRIQAHTGLIPVDQDGHAHDFTAEP